ncbi:MAG: YtxH domain-containing protein [Patescibacteria group bacterium]|nr:YtxH domain-containing protein [Patescibacteria group bacterium]
MPSMPTKKSSHLGLGLAIGALVGVAAGLFAQSKKGKDLMKDAEKTAKVLQAKIMHELKGAETITKKQYEDMVDKVTDYYVQTKKVAKKEIPEIRSFLMKKWTTVQKELKKM